MTDKRETMEGIASGLAALDDTLRQSHKTGGPGTGIFFLLDNLAVSTHAAPRTAFPMPEPEPAPVEGETRSGGPVDA